jgi:ketosteroid isomerase-like protein
MAQAAIPVKGATQLHLGWLGLGAIVIAVALGAGLIGYYAGTRQPTTGIADQALVDQSISAWSGTYDAAKVAAVYASDAAFVDNIAGETSTGLAAIQAKIDTYLTDYSFVTRAAAAPIQLGDTIVSVVNYGTGNAATETAVAVMQVKDGKIIRHTVYPMP